MLIIGKFKIANRGHSVTWLKVLTISLLLLSSLASGCEPQGAKIYSEPKQEIKVHIDEQFTIALEANPTTGYEWRATFDESLLKLVESKFEPCKQAEGMVGVGGKQYFTFRALKPGKTSVTLTYQRPWEEHPIDQKIFTVNIK